jgi:hypothetical protein
MKSISQSWQGWQIRLSRLLLSCFLLAASQLTHAGLKEDLETGSYVLMMRHAESFTLAAQLFICWINSSCPL